jgi:tetratricopeptide (TPR) repeat protein
MNEDKTTGKDMDVIAGGSKRVSKKLWLKIVILLVVLVIAGAAAWWFMYRNAGYLNIGGLDSKNEKIATAQELAKQPLPDKPLDKAIYYGDIGAYLQAAKEYAYAEHYYLTAQKVVDDSHVDMKEVRFYSQLADVYKALNNNAKADEYTKKEDAFIKANYSQADIDMMKGSTLDTPHKQ